MNQYKPKYLVVSAVKDRVKDLNRQAGQEFIVELDRIVDRIILSVCSEHNGGRKRLDRSLIPVKWR